MDCESVEDAAYARIKSTVLYRNINWLKWFANSQTSRDLFHRTDDKDWGKGSYELNFDLIS